MLKVGMLGMGGISRSHYTSWKQIPEAELVAVCDVRKECADKAAEATGAKVYTDFEEMMAAERLDILDICLPTYLHAEYALRALNRGVHVLSEKPVSLKREDVAKLYDAAKKNNRRFMVAQVLRFWREYEILKETVKSGRYGRLLSGHMSRLGNTPQWSWENWMLDPERSGLVPFDLHIHDLDFLIYAFGAPKDMVCHRATTEAQDYFSVIYEYPDFFISTEAAWYNCSYPFQAAFRFQFENGVLEYRGGVLTAYEAGKDPYVFEAETDANVNGINLPATNGYFNEIRYFTDCVLAGKDCDKVQAWELECVLDLIDRIHQAKK